MEHLSSPPSLFSLPSESSFLIPCIPFLLLLHTASSSNLSSHHRGREHFGDSRLFPARFLPKHLTDCISHCCIVSGNHGIVVYVTWRIFANLNQNREHMSEKYRMHVCVCQTYFCLEKKVSNKVFVLKGYVCLEVTLTLWCEISKVVFNTCRCT